MNAQAPITADEIAHGATMQGAYTASTLAQWGVPWPAPKGWKETLLRFGVPFKRSEHEEHELQKAQRLLRVAVLKVVETGNAHLFDDEAELLAYFGAVNPNPTTPIEAETAA